MKKRLLAIFIVIIMLLSTTTVFASIDLDTSTVNFNDTEYLPEEENETVARENEELREANIKHFDLSNGISKAVMYSQAVHYLDENGKWVDIDNSLSLSGNEYSTNNKTEVKFSSKSGSSGLLSIKDGEYKIDLTPLGSNQVSVEIENPQENNSRKFDDVKKLSNLVSKAIYENIYDGIDLEYILTGNNVKENIIVNSEQDNYVYTFELKLNKLNAELVDNSIALYDSDTGEKMYVIPAPYMYDSAGELSQEVEYTLTKNNKWKYTLTVTANAEWINSEERSFPVTIDPTIVADIVDDDAFVMFDGIYDDMTYLIVGNFMSGSYKDVPGFIKFNTLPDIPQGSRLVKAEASMYISYVENSLGTDFYLGVYETTRDWVESGFEDVSEAISAYLSQMTADNYNDFKSALQSYYASTPESSEKMISDGTYEWEITSLYERWKSGTENHGICIKGVGLPEGPNANVRIRTLEDANQNVPPQLELTYVNHIGVEDYYGYAYNTLGSYGESYVNLYNGSLTYINHLTTVSNGSLSYDINMVYNSIDKAWKPSFSENIELYDEDGIERYIWTDADGTKHWFTPYLQKNYYGAYISYEQASTGELWQTTNPVTFYPEDDIDYVLTQTANNELILKDYQGNQKLFDENGRLSRICDAQGNVLHFNNYLGIDQNNVASIYTKDSTTGEVSFSLEIFYFNSGRISQIFDNQNQKKIEFSWTNGLLNTISYFDFDIETSYETIYFQHYNSNNKLSSVFDDFTKQKIKYYIEANDEEDSTDDNKIVEILNNNGNLEQTIKKYIIGESFYVNLGNDFIFNTSDDLLTTFAFDNRGRKVTTTTANIIETYTYNDSILPDDTYYSTTYNQSINNQGFNIVKHNMQTNANEYISLTEQNTIFDLSNITTTSDWVDKGNSISKVCKIKAYYGGVSSSWRESTGFLSGPKTLIMSGHGLLEDTVNDGIVNQEFPTKIEVIPGCYQENGIEKTPFGIYEVETCYIQREYSYLWNDNHSQSFQYDWAVCVLDETVGSELGWFDLIVSDENIINQYALVYGYIEETANLRLAKGRIEIIQSKTVRYSSDTIRGMSGGPVFLNNEDYLVFGIHVAEGENACAKKIDLLIYTLVNNLNSTEKE